MPVRTRPLLLVVVWTLGFAGCGGEHAPTPVAVTGAPVFESGPTVDLPGEAVGSEAALAMRLELAPITEENLRGFIESMTADMAAENRQAAQMGGAMMAGMLIRVSEALRQAGGEAVVLSSSPAATPQGGNATLLLQVQPDAEPDAVQQALRAMPQMPLPPDATLEKLGEQYMVLQGGGARLPAEPDATRAALLSQALSMTEAGALRLAFVMTQEARDALQQQMDRTPQSEPLAEQGRAMVAAMQTMQFGGVTLGVEGEPTLSALATFDSSADAEQFVAAWNEVLSGVQQQATSQGVAQQATEAMSSLEPTLDGTVVSLKLDAEQLRALGRLGGGVRAQAQITTDIDLSSETTPAPPPTE